VFESPSSPLSFTHHSLSSTEPVAPNVVRKGHGDARAPCWPYIRGDWAPPSRLPPQRPILGSFLPGSSWSASSPLTTSHDHDSDAASKHPSVASESDTLLLRSSVWSSGCSHGHPASSSPSSPPNRLRRKAEALATGWALRFLLK